MEKMRATWWLKKISKTALVVLMYHTLYLLPQGKEWVYIYYICNSCTMGPSDLPDIYTHALGLWCTYQASHEVTWYNWYMWFRLIACALIASCGQPIIQANIRCYTWFLIALLMSIMGRNVLAMFASKCESCTDIMEATQSILRFYKCLKAALWFKHFLVSYLSI